MADEVTPQTASAADTHAPDATAMADAPAKEGDGDTGARKPDAAAATKAPAKGLSPDDHYSRGKRRTMELVEQQLEERFGVRSLDELAERLALRERDSEPEEGGKPSLPDVRALKRQATKLGEEHAALTARYERATRELQAGRERFRMSALHAALAAAGALYPEDEAQVLSRHVGVSASWEPEEIDDKGAPTGRTVADVVAARREQRPEFYRGESREGTGSRPARAIPQPGTNGKTPTADPTSPAWMAARLAERGIR